MKKIFAIYFLVTLSLFVGAQSYEVEYNPAPISNKPKTQPVYVPQDNILLEEISLKDIKNIYKEYDQVVGGYPLKLFIKENGGLYSFKVTKPIPGQTYIAAEFTLIEILRLNKVNTLANRVFTFEKEDSNKGIILLKIVAFKK